MKRIISTLAICLALAACSKPKVAEQNPTQDYAVKARLADEDFLQSPPAACMRHLLSDDCRSWTRYNGDLVWRNRSCKFKFEPEFKRCDALREKDMADEDRKAKEQNDAYAKEQEEQRQKDLKIIEEAASPLLHGSFSTPTFPPQNMDTP